MLFRDPPQCLPTGSVLRALRAVRVRRIGGLGHTIHDAICDELRAAGFVFRRECIKLMDRSPMRGEQDDF